MPRAVFGRVRIGSSDREEHFWSKVDRSLDENACWEWTDHRKANGYGQYWIERKPVYAHVFAYMLGHPSEPWPKRGEELCHSCDNPPCCNQRHLSRGTRKSNAEDAARKGRAASKRNGRWRGGDVRGAKNPSAKLSEQDVLAIRCASGPQRAIGQRFGVSQVAVSGIKLRKLWGHVPEEADATDGPRG